VPVKLLPVRFLHIGLSLKLYAINQTQAQALEDGFKKNAEGLYNKIIEMILEN
jgi:hypothetical protein